jgi:hypothetical protein
MKKSISAAAAAVVALGPISLFVFIPVFVAAPANACEGGPAAVQMCILACNYGGQSAECPSSAAQPARPPQQVPAALPPPPKVAPPPPAAPPEAPPPPPAQPAAAPAPPPAAAGMSPGAVATWPGGVAADCGNAVYAAHYSFFCASAPGAPQIQNNPYPPGVSLNTPDTVPNATPAAPAAAPVPPPVPLGQPDAPASVAPAPGVVVPGPQIADSGGSGLFPDNGPPNDPGTTNVLYGGECNLMADKNCMPLDQNDPRIGVPDNAIGDCILVRDPGCHPKNQG